MRTRMSGGVRGVRSNAAPISIIVMSRCEMAKLTNPSLGVTLLWQILQRHCSIRRSGHLRLRIQLNRLTVSNS